MKNEHQENGAPRGPLILLVPASNFVAVMNLDWLDGTNRAAGSATMEVGRRHLKTLASSVRALFARGVLNKAGRWKLADRSSEPMPPSASFSLAVFQVAHFGAFL
jgi:hypothetical protein